MGGVRDTTVTVIGNARIVTYALSNAIRFKLYPNGQRILQQAWMGDDGSLKWEQVPCVSYEEKDEP